jgi:energy-coupling factor transporter ATP-binding protein EcfA2
LVFYVLVNETIQRMPNSRLPETRTLSQILPKGTEGGKEFARIVDLLLFHEARRKGRTINLFSDVSGDYRGLDSFGASSDGLRRNGTEGYQYKFFPSPLSAKHRAEIKASLKKAAEHQKKLNLKKWILVTPENFTETVQRKDLGDVSWFQGLKDELQLEFEIESWGHRQLQGLFLETPSLCLFYYPELLPEGSTKRRSIQDTRQRYDNNLLATYRNIEFVGMSIYKPEATRGVRIEDIYIPLTLVAEGANSDDPKVPRTNPLAVLASGSRTVVLGDPGSGKSTLLRFLALVGVSEPLQKRCSSKPDDRLPVLVLLRRYADELHNRPNLALLDYIIECARADFSLASANQEFFEYYLESGQTLLFFDGLDELSHSPLKQKVRDRIRSLVTTYPGNTVVVTSRIVGYENPFRFDEKEFDHHRVARLRLPEIEQFVGDWYAARIEHPKEREKNSSDLIRLLKRNEQSAIRELAGNPLLLTIIALVHRIDAVLPDERVVLYQKCTETLLNTWHTWQLKESQTSNRGKTERRNNRRMEAIAHWIQTRTETTSDGQRAVVRYNDLLKFLTEHIARHEKVADKDDALDFASEFLDFVKRRAGLLIEVGDQQYSFVHLTFQEYLTASHISTQSENEGVKSAWSEYIEPRRCDPAWREVIRLFVASLKADTSQEFLVQQLLERTRNSPDVNGATLLGGLVLDGIEAAEAVQSDIARCLLAATVKVTQVQSLRQIIDIWRNCFERNEQSRSELQAAFKSYWTVLDNDQQRLALVLMLLTSGWTLQDVASAAGSFVMNPTAKTMMLRLLIPVELASSIPIIRPPEWDRYVALMQWASSISITTNLVAGTAGAVARSLNPAETGGILLRVFAFAFRDMNSGPLACLFSHGAIVYSGSAGNQLTSGQVTALVRIRARARPRAPAQVLVPAQAQVQAQILAREHALALARARARARARALDWDLDLDLEINQHGGSSNDLWSWAVSNAKFEKYYLDLLCDTFKLQPRIHWEEALRKLFLTTVPERMDFMAPENWRAVEERYEIERLNTGDDDYAAWLLLLDSWLWIGEVYQTPQDSNFVRLASLTRSTAAPSLCFAHCIRDLAYGDESRTQDLVDMVRSEEPAYRRMFEEFLWRLTPEEEIKEAKRENSK